MNTEHDLDRLSHAEKDALILSLSARLDEALKLIAALQARIGELTRPGKTPDNSSLPPSKGQKPDRQDAQARHGRRPGSVGRKGGGRELTVDPDETVTAHAARCEHCQAPFDQADHRLDADSNASRPPFPI